MSTYCIDEVGFDGNAYLYNIIRDGVIIVPKMIYPKAAIAVEQFMNPGDVYQESSHGKLEVEYTYEQYAADREKNLRFDAGFRD